MKGETDLLDPEYVKLLNRKGRNLTVSMTTETLSDIPTEAVMGFHTVATHEVISVLRDEFETWAEELTYEEVHALHKYTKNSFEKDGTKFFQRLNEMLRGVRPEDSKLEYYSRILSQAITKKPLENGIVCYRNLKVNPFEGAKVGDKVPGLQFFSTSVVPARALKGDFHLTIIAPPGTLGAYIENVSRVPSQREFLLDKSCWYKILAQKENEIVLEVIV